MGLPVTVQIAQALLQGEPLGLGTGPECGHHVIIELADEHPLPGDSRVCAAQNHLPPEDDARIAVLNHRTANLAVIA